MVRFETGSYILASRLQSPAHLIPAYGTPPGSPDGCSAMSAELYSPQRRACRRASTEVEGWDSLSIIKRRQSERALHNLGHVVSSPAGVLCCVLSSNATPGSVAERPLCSKLR